MSAVAGEAERIQDALRAMAQEGRELVAIPPFTATIDASDAMTFLNYAVPDRGAAAWPMAAIEELCRVYRARGRVPRLEFVQDCWPGLEQVLLAQGFAVELRPLGMACTAAELRDPPLPAGVTVEAVGRSAPEASIVALLRTRGAAFAELAEPDAPGEVQVARFRRRGPDSVLARSAAGEPVGAASWQRAQLGVTEIVAVGVPAPHRRQGIAAALTAFAARAAFAQGAELAFLTPGGDAAGRVYARAGFRPSVRCLHISRR